VQSAIKLFFEQIQSLLIRLNYFILKYKLNSISETRIKTKIYFSGVNCRDSGLVLHCIFKAAV